MTFNSSNDYFLSSFKGLSYFIRNPSLWWFPLIGMLLFSTILVAIFVFVMIVMWPNIDLSFWSKFWHILKAFGLSTAALLIGFIILMPAVITLVLDRMLRKMFHKLKDPILETGFFKSFYSSTVIFFKTIFWRLMWPVVGVISALFLGPIGAFISQLGIGHLAAIDAFDLTLALKGFDTNKRVSFYKSNRKQVFMIGLFGAFLSMALSITIIGWLIWLPSIFIGVALWIREWPEVKNTTLVS